MRKDWRRFEVSKAGLQGRRAAQELTLCRQQKKSEESSSHISWVESRDHMLSVLCGINHSADQEAPLLAQRSRSHTRRMFPRWQHKIRMTHISMEVLFPRIFYSEYTIMCQLSISLESLKPMRLVRVSKSKLLAGSFIWTEQSWLLFDLHRQWITITYNIINRT